MTQTLDHLYQAVQATRPLLRNITAAVEQGSRRHGVTVGQRAILEGLFLHPDATAPVLGSELQMKRQYVARVLQEVIAAELVKKLPNPDRARSWRYRLTAKGKDVISAIRADETSKLIAFAEGQTTEDLDAYCRLQIALTQYFALLAKES
ncbi:winged helix-turn-helix transcriptional regulator [Tropicibacter sp. R16_0]|uniref:MarR family winged helix-turn-helix transcriptional regulator n=1 Tax=Tropicibacter sp. R16_0 TaxID=2821102 RepID=UPI001ADC8BBA|nr:MarR family winged helix-turn-helix transcriptional regulator [Tropicibacter sp. R16_0]MBO9451833.1 winged helix-turn-helix transcriptional regulator [Tropicibacter sp. R16_0]